MSEHFRNDGPVAMLLSTDSSRGLIQMSFAPAITSTFFRPNHARALAIALLRRADQLDPPDAQMNGIEFPYSEKA